MINAEILQPKMGIHLNLTMESYILLTQMWIFLGVWVMHFSLIIAQWLDICMKLAMVLDFSIHLQQTITIRMLIGLLLDSMEMLGTKCRMLPLSKLQLLIILPNGDHGAQDLIHIILIVWDGSLVIKYSDLVQIIFIVEILICVLLVLHKSQDTC